MRSGWVCRPLCVFLRFRCRVGLCVVAWRAWSGWVRRPLCLHLRLPCGVGLQYVCPRGRCGVAGHVGLSALTCVFPMGTNCIVLAGPVRSGWAPGHVGLSALTCVFPVGSNYAVLAEPARSGWARRPLCVRLCPCCGVGLRRLFVCLLFICMLPPLVRPPAVRLPVPRVGRSRSVFVFRVSVPSPCSPLSPSPLPPLPWGAALCSWPP